MKYEYDSYNCILYSTSLNTHATTASALAAKQAQVNDAAPDSIMPNSFVYLRSLPFNWSSHHTTYWQHSDHLGSASWVTDTNGRGYQHFQYRAWGEPFIEQNSTANGYETRYTFSGKERDEETGYSYFGSRYYNSSLSIWLSVDPMADKYPGVSPYVYCANNPVRLVDPDGDTIINFYKQIVIDAQEIYNRAVSQNQPDLSHETKVLEEAKISCYYVDRFINGLSDDQYKALNNIKDEQGNPINIIVDINYNLETVAANKPLWTKGKQLRGNRLYISINPFRDANNNESNSPIIDWRKIARHEGGHAYYIIRKSMEYFDWLVKKGHIDENGNPLHKYNGHGKNDPSARHAQIWETGIINLIND